eukprot:6689219-Pyramimonas_sp.AAC.1
MPSVSSSRRSASTSRCVTFVSRLRGAIPAVASRLCHASGGRSRWVRYWYVTPPGAIPAGALRLCHASRGDPGGCVVIMSRLRG